MLLVAGCTSEPEFPTELTRDEERLVEEVLALIEVRIARARDAEEAEAKRQALPGLYDETQIEALVEALSERPERGQLVVGAVHESLKARRERLLPPPRPDR